ncbi:glycosyltransferase family 2 protein [Nitrosopumilus piranensis]|uniref:Glycosyltransferase, group 2 family protein n=1 Tax=Nitrosopumilus piranensis TaxID=1582439 RepID=A0A0C5BT27_9ARCH|nr:glycosyltransferase family 2 protein [Nitrosopumilus piranensis]AJM91299.1 Glycosyltransferase, group 2 family protein [Nitrosopumilus piranensis]
MIIACIPAFNEGKIIRTLVKNILQYVDRVIVCDDGSNDNTSTEAKKAGATVIEHEKNFGKGAAMRTLFDFAKNENFDVMITIDGDGQFSPKEIPKLISPIINERVDIVIGFRSNKDEMPSYRKFGNKFLDSMTNLASELPFRDTQSGFRSYSKKAVSVISFRTNGFGADSEILIDASRKKLNIVEVGVTVSYNTGEKTSTKDPISHISEVITSLIESIAISHPLKYLGIPGMLLLIIGVGFLIWSISFFNEVRFFPIPLLVSAIGSMMIGTMLLLMSVVLYGISKIKIKN